MHAGFFPSGSYGISGIATCRLSTIVSDLRQQVKVPVAGRTYQYIGIVQCVSKARFNVLRWNDAGRDVVLHLITMCYNNTRLAGARLSIPATLSAGICLGSQNLFFLFQLSNLGI